MDVEPLEVAAWQLIVGELRSEDLPGLATDALVRGIESPTLGELAGQGVWDVRTSVDLFREVLVELGIELCERDAALWKLVREAASRLVAGEMSPAEWSNSVWRWYQEIEDNGDLRIFVGLADEIDDHPEILLRLETQIVQEAVELLSRPRPRVWIRLMAVDSDTALSRSICTESVAIAPSSLPIDERLCADLNVWNNWHIGVLSQWPRRGGFRSVDEAERFVQAGRLLVDRLQEQLGADFHVEYIPEPIRPPGVKLVRGP